MAGKGLTAKCGATGFKSVQGLRGHERLCPKCQGQIDKKNEQLSTNRSSTQKPINKDCQHNYIPLTEKQKALRNEQGESIGEMGFDVICTKCKDLK